MVASGLPSSLQIAQHVSIPFIAGQWSLQEAELFGAIDALIVSIPFIAGQWSLRYLRDAGNTPTKEVSIPFIAGQWSLPI